MKFAVGDFVFVFEVSPNRPSHGFGYVTAAPYSYRQTPQGPKDFRYWVAMCKKYSKYSQQPMVIVKEESMSKAWQTLYGEVKEGDALRCR